MKITKVPKHWKAILWNPQGGLCKAWDATADEIPMNTLGRDDCVTVRTGRRTLCLIPVGEFCLQIEAIAEEVPANEPV